MLTVKIEKLLKNEIEDFQITIYNNLITTHDKKNYITKFLKDIGLDNIKSHSSFRRHVANKGKCIKKEKIPVIQCTVKYCILKK